MMLSAMYISYVLVMVFLFFFFQAEDGIRDHCVTGVQTCALPILTAVRRTPQRLARRESADRTPQGRAVPGPAIERLVEHVEQQSDAPVAAHRGQIGRASCRERV